jgi:DNA polymerase-1
MIVASPGFYLVEADYSGAEVALAAFQSDDRKMIADVLNPKHDMHSFVACLAFGLQCEKSKKGLESIGKSHYRHLAKIVFFRLSYGGGPKAIVIQANALGLPVSLEDAEQVISTIFRLYPNFHEWLEACAARAISPRWIATHGRSFRRVPATDDTGIQVSYGRQFKNFPEQGGVADVVNEAVYNGIVYREETGMNYRTVLQVHDSLLYEVDESQVKRFMNDAVPEFMCRRIPIFATDLNGIRTGKRYYLRVGVNIYKKWGETIDIQ